MSAYEHALQSLRNLRGGFYEYDVRLGIVGLAAAQRFLNRGEAIRWIEVKGRDVLEVSTLKRSLQADRSV